MEEQHNQDSDFMKETIKQRPLNKKKLVRRTLITAAMAVVFGLVACLTFLLLEPVISNKLYPEEEPSTVVFVEETAENEKLPEDMIADESQMKQEEEEMAPALEQEQIAQVLSEFKLGTEEYTALYHSLAEVALTVQKSMVTVVGVTADVDWLNNPYENEGRISGVIIFDNGRELLIAANINSIQNADSIKVTFYDGNDCQAVIKGKDNNTGLAVLSVMKSNLKSSTLETAKPVELGTSAGISMLGNPVIAVGQPIGNVDSVCYGFITSMNNAIDMPDSIYKQITTDIYGSTSARGVLVNLRGQVIGIIDMTHNASDTKNLLSAIGITELRKLFNVLLSDGKVAYMGVYGTDVTEQANQELNVPYGAYIMEIEMDSPAMAAGIQSGDVITKFNDKEIGNYADLINKLMDAVPEQNAAITVMRQGPEGYTEMEITVALANK